MVPEHIEIVYKTKDFMWGVENAHGKKFMHIDIKEFNPRTFKKMKRSLCKLRKGFNEPLYGYGLDDSTYRLMDAFGFKETGLITVIENKRRRIKCLF